MPSTLESYLKHYMKVLLYNMDSLKYYKDIDLLSEVVDIQCYIEPFPLANPPSEYMTIEHFYWGMVTKW